MRIVIGEASALFREGLARLLADADHDVVAKAVDAPSLVAAVHAERPDLAIIDIRMRSAVRGHEPAGRELCAVRVRGSNRTARLRHRPTRLRLGWTQAATRGRHRVRFRGKHRPA